jgi:methionine-rich copper-binding protein CopC
VSTHTRRLAVFALAFLTASGVAGAAAFHLRLEKSEPADKTELAKAPVELRLWFSEVTQLPLTRLTLLRGTDTVALEKLTRAPEEKAPVVAKIHDTVKPGAYTINWRTMGKDGHAITGKIGFTVK